MKDPAVLFYTQDFITGTILMNDEQRGKYIMLLCLQHQNGKLTERDMLKICGEKDEDIWCKFYQEDGYFYNKRMLLETEKRIKHSQKQRENVNKRWNKDTKTIPNKYQNDTLLEDENENENEDVIKNKEEKEIFDIFRKKYPGTKRGNETEFLNFIKKHKDWKEVLLLLLKRLNYQKEARQIRKENKLFMPEWKNLQTWINQRCWEDKINTDE